jgi:hypothetical protein
VDHDDPAAVRTAALLDGAGSSAPKTAKPLVGASVCPHFSAVAGVKSGRPGEGDAPFEGVMPYTKEDSTLTAAELFHPSRVTCERCHALSGVAVEYTYRKAA